MHDPQSAENCAAEVQIPDEILEQAAAWLIDLQDEDVDQNLKNDFEAWQQQDPLHAQAVAEMRQIMGYFAQAQHQQHKTLPRQIVENVLEQEATSLSQRVLRSSNLFLIVLLSSMMIGLLSWQLLPIDYWLADQRNDHHQWQQQILSDHSLIKTSGKTAYNIKFDQNSRVIELLEGNILVDVAKDARRPFIVETKYARITALGTRFMVQHSKNATILTMLESKTKVELLNQHNHQATTLEVRAGQQLMIDANGSYSTMEISPELLQRAWQQHLLVVQDMPLPQVLAILQSYREIGLVYDAKQLQHITVNATLPLDQDVLDLLQKSLPIRIEQDFLGRMKVVEKN